MKSIISILILVCSNYFIASSQSNQAVIVTAGTNHSLYRCLDNMVYSFGDNSSGQLGIGSFNDAISPTPISMLSGIVDIASSGFHTLLLKNDGTVWACGWNFAGQLGDSTNIDRATPVQVLGLTNIVDIAAGQSHSVFVKDDGTVWALW
jgi:alpha-tubulin suppressor-like RCC1 family protein